MVQLNSAVVLAWSLNSNISAMGILAEIKSTLPAQQRKPARLKTLILHIIRSLLICNGTVSELDTDSIMGSLWIRPVRFLMCFHVF